MNTNRMVSLSESLDRQKKFMHEKNAEIRKAMAVKDHETVKRLQRELIDGITVFHNEQEQIYKVEG